MNKFGLEPEPSVKIQADQSDIAKRIAAFPVAATREKIDLNAMDAAAANHGFTSREAPLALSPDRPIIRRRRIGTAEPTRHLAIRLSEKQYARFVAFADQQQLTYHDALAMLLDHCGY